VGGHDLANDRQTEPGSAAATVAWLVEPGEAVADEVNGLRRSEMKMARRISTAAHRLGLAADPGAVLGYR
jgi:hypothetical protein